MRHAFRCGLLLVGSLLTTLRLGAAEPAATPVVFHPGWFPSAQFAGVFVAADAGFYADAGLDVEIRDFAYGQDSTANLQAAPEVCTLGSIEGYILLQKLDDGDDLVALRPMLHRSPAGVMTFADSGITGAADFANRRIGVHAYADALFHWFATHAGLAVDAPQWVRVEDDVQDLITGHVDAMQGYATEEYVELTARVAPRATRFISFAELGFPSYSEILYTTRAQHTRHADTLQRFVAATRRGWEQALADPERAAAAVLARLSPEADRAHTIATLSALRPYVLDADGHALPAMDPARWAELITVAREMNLITGDLAPPTAWLR